MDTVEALVKKALSSEPEADNAILTLGLLLEQRTSQRPMGDDGGVALVVGSKLASYKLTEKEANHIVKVLTEAVMKPTVRTSMLWALMKSGDRSRSTHSAFRSVLKQTLNHSERQILAEQALEGLLAFGKEALPDIKFAAEYGTGDIQEAAQDYLDVFG